MGTWAPTQLLQGSIFFICYDTYTSWRFGVGEIGSVPSMDLYEYECLAHLGHSN